MGKLTFSQKALILETYKKWRVWSNVKKISFEKWGFSKGGGHDLVETRNDGRKSNLRVRGCTIHWLDFDLITFPLQARPHKTYWRRICEFWRRDKGKNLILYFFGCHHRAWPFIAFDEKQSYSTWKGRFVRCKLVIGWTKWTCPINEYLTLCRFS